MELLIVVIKKEISVGKLQDGLRDYHEKLKAEEENARKAKKSIRMLPRKK
jgi:hypothetical protein